MQKILPRKIFSGLVNFATSIIASVLFTTIILVGGIYTQRERATLIAEPASSTYTWRESVTADWQLPSSWAPERINPAPSDILIFIIGGTTTATNVPTETIGQFIIAGNTTVNLQSTSPVTLTISGADGEDFTIAPNSALNFNGNNAIICNLATNATGGINGFLRFSPSIAVAHRLTATDVGAVRFNNGGVFMATGGFKGNPFGTTSLNSVVFESGSVYICIAGGDPFGATEPASVVTFKPGSLFSLQGNVTPACSGRTYGNFEVNYPAAEFTASGSSALIVDDLNLVAGNLNFNMTGNPGHSIKGNITVSQGTRLNFSPIVPATVTLNGKALQTVTLHGSQGAGGTLTLAVDNPMGINGPLTTENLELINGVVTPGPTWNVLVGGNITRTNGYVNGFLLRRVSKPGIVTFDLGTENGYAPVIAEVMDGSFPAALSVGEFQGPQPNILDPPKALSRYWNVRPIGLTTNVTFNYFDPIDIPATATESHFVIQRYRSGFTQPGGMINPVLNTFTVTEVAQSADWTLAEPGAVTTPTATATNTATSTASATATATATSTPSGLRAVFDYDGDHKTDISVFRQSEGAWYLAQSQAGFYGAQFGIATDKITPADFDGDGKTDIAVYRPSTGIWYVLNSSNGTVSYYQFGLSEDLPTPADYDGDGRADVSVFRPSTGVWHRQNSSNGAFIGVHFGASEDKPIVGDFDGDGRSDIAVFRPSTGAWYWINSGDSSIHGEIFGFGTDILTPADYDGDSKTDLAVFRPSDGYWYIRNSSNGVFRYNVFGLATDIPAPGDFDGDGRADINVFRPSDGTWYRQNSSNGQFVATPFGTNGDKPTMTAFRY